MYIVLVCITIVWFSVPALVFRSILVNLVHIRSCGSVDDSLYPTERKFLPKSSQRLSRYRCVYRNELSWCGVWTTRPRSPDFYVTWGHYTTRQTDNSRQYQKLPTVVFSTTVMHVDSRVGEGVFDQFTENEGTKNTDTHSPKRWHLTRIDSPNRHFIESGDSDPLTHDDESFVSDQPSSTQ